MVKLRSSLIADRVIYDAKDRCLRPSTETLEAGTSYEVVATSEKLPGVSRAPCSIIVANGKVYITLATALEYAGFIIGDRF